MTEAERKRDARLRREFGITLEEWYMVFKYQGGACAVCRQPPKVGRSLCVDHCHLTGRLRGLLCFQCNKFIIGNHVDATKLKAAVKYLENFPVNLALGKDIITATGKVGTKKRAKLLSKLKGPHPKGKNASTIRNKKRKVCKN